MPVSLPILLKLLCCKRQPRAEKQEISGVWRLLPHLFPPVSAHSSGISTCRDQPRFVTVRSLLSTCFALHPFLKHSSQCFIVMCEPDFGTMCFQMFVFMLFILPGTDTVSKADAERNLSTIKVVNSSWFFFQSLMTWLHLCKNLWLK